MSTQACNKYKISFATRDNVDIITWLIDEASKWLRLKDTDQWERPWPNEEARRKRILDGMRDGYTWIVWDGEDPVATVSITHKGNPLLWRKDELDDKAVYLHRLVINRKYGGQRVGAALLEWAAQQGRIRYGAKDIRIDVWTDNSDLHAYYRSLGFRAPNGKDEVEIRVHDKNKWPSGAVFQRPVEYPEARQKVQHIEFEPTSPEVAAPVESKEAPGSRDSQFQEFTQKAAMASPH